MTEKIFAIIIIIACSVIWLSAVVGSIGCAIGKRKALKKEWISVKKSLPTEEDGGWVLAHVHINNDIDNFTIVAYYIEGEWFRDADFCKLSDIGITVTHWMPLPEPPKENKITLEV